MREESARKNPGDFFVAWGKTLRSKRKEAGLTQEGLSQRSKISRRAIVYLEAGQREPTPGTIALLRLSLPSLPSPRGGLDA